MSFHSWRKSLSAREPETHPGVEIIVYNQASENHLDAVSLPISGTGIRQVLAMLYVRVTAKYPRFEKDQSDFSKIAEIIEGLLDKFTPEPEPR